MLVSGQIFLDHTVMRCEMFTNMFYEIYIGEKWFYPTQSMRKYYLENNYGDPYKSTKIKRFITTVIFFLQRKGHVEKQGSSAYFMGKWYLVPRYQRVYKMFYPQSIFWYYCYQGNYFSNCQYL